MGIFNKAVVTAKGQALLAKSVAGLCGIQFTRLALSEERLSGDLISVTDIGEVKQSSAISAMEIRDDVSVSMEAVFANTELTVGYYIRNIGLYAVDPDEGEILYSVSVADESEVSAGYMPPFDGMFVKSLLIELVTAVSSVDNVTVAVDPTVYATVTQLERAIRDHKHSPESIGAADRQHSHKKSDINDFPTKMDPTAHKHPKSDIDDFPLEMTPSSHNQSASTIDAGTFGGRVAASASGQAPSEMCLRNSKIVSADTDPTVNGEISWTYK